MRNRARRASGGRNPRCPRVTAPCSHLFEWEIGHHEFAVESLQECAILRQSDGHAFQHVHGGEGKGEGKGGGGCGWLTARRDGRCGRTAVGGWMDQSVAMHMRARMEAVVSRLPLVIHLATGRSHRHVGRRRRARRLKKRSGALAHRRCECECASARPSLSLWLSAKSLAHPLLHNSSMEWRTLIAVDRPDEWRVLVAAASRGCWQHSCVVRLSARRWASFG